MIANYCYTIRLDISSQTYKHMLVNIKQKKAIKLLEITGNGAFK